MRVAMPTGTTHGWGIAGSYLSAEIGKLSPIDGVTLHSVAGHHFAPSFAEQWGHINIGYCFFESEIIAYRHIPKAAKQWDYIVAGSSWCEYHLRIAGMERTSTILQGVDASVFSPTALRQPDGRFIVFSGGKFEFRKGHDLVIAAMREFMCRHPDVWLACAWHNHWPMSIRTMEQSRLIEFSYQEVSCDELFLRLLAAEGIPLDRVLLYPVLDNRQMRQVYQASDLGLFPNRCEGGNNMVMCEFMACGRPVIASSMTGHRDVITSQNALCLTNYEPVVAVQEGAPAGVWFEPSVNEMIELLEHAYADRAGLQKIADSAGISMKALSWQSAALKFHEVARQLAGAVNHDVAWRANSFNEQIEYAEQCFRGEQYEQAAQAYMLLLKKFPLDPGLLNNVGTTLDRLKRYSEAILHYEKALALKPSFSEARYNLANSLQRSGNTVAAVRELELVLAERPDFVAAWQNLALCLLEQKDLPGSVSALEHVLKIDPDNLKSRTDMGEFLVELGRYRDALTCFDEVLLQDPANSGVLNAKGTTLQRLNDLDGAEQCYQRILLFDPDNALALNNMGTVMRSRALPEQAIVFFEQALANAPEDGKILFNKALAELAMGNFADGWSNYESRFDIGAGRKRHTAIPRWRGESLLGKRILVWCEQGYGDSIQFVRYASSLSAEGAFVLLEAQDERIAPLLACAHGVSKVVVRGKHEYEVDYQIPLLSLPRFFGNVPCPPQYIELVRDSEVRFEGLDESDGSLKVGLAWAGRPAHEDDRNRSIASDLLSSLAECNGIRFVNLQFSQAECPAKLAMFDVTSQIHSFADSAALILQLDLVISVDTAVAHLAGALGVPVWVLLPYNPDWRWLLGREDTPWYASARLFRQKVPFQWDEVVSSVARELNLKRTEK